MVFLVSSACPFLCLWFVHQQIVPGRLLVGRISAQGSVYQFWPFPCLGEAEKPWTVYRTALFWRNLFTLFKAYEVAIKSPFSKFLHSMVASCNSSTFLLMHEHFHFHAWTLSCAYWNDSVIQSQLLWVSILRRWHWHRTWFGSFPVFPPASIASITTKQKKKKKIILT